ncbi:peptidoglycan DD-metalloendopeptidase family protein [Shewanella sp. UCD-KL21]|uniref:peptidoglycan DD-metalloendopeptidase family protein n=1 Tax=Shewanella sp. UCD-KL21 TaxID=1917164 RepID=UPI0009702A6D|nr:peptidoglycan DD-metalloendopeptidase family protein [Shewanella sp. UCD-KL21]
MDKLQTLVAKAQNLPTLHRKLLLASVFIVAAALLWPTPQEFASQRIPVALDIEALIPQVANYTPVEISEPVAPTFERVIEQGDTLSQLFEIAGIGQQTMYKVLEADLNVLALDTLSPGNRIRFWQDEQQNLTQLELYFNPAYQVVFSRFDDGSYEVNEVNIEGIWQNRIISGEINGSFYLSAQRSGLSAAQIQTIETLLSSKLKFSRDLRAGDKFSVLMNDQFIEGVSTGASKLEAVRIETKGRNISAFQNVDGNFYDDKGQGLASAFQRVPLERQYRLSSHFNPTRKHPVTGRVSPHNGTDFATPTGTRVVAPGDGVVSMVTNHRFAGKYIVIEHDNNVRTRYLHMSKFLVRKGQRVKRGQVIGLSGSTGRVTGPHLHYEFHVNGRPVNPMKVSIIEASVLPKKQMNAFKQLVKTKQMMMDLG